MRLLACNGTPLLDAVIQRARSRKEVALHVPGHKRGRGAPKKLLDLIGQDAFSSDLTELQGLDNLQSPQSVIQEAQELAAHTFGAQKTWFLVNGCTVGIQTAILATCPPHSTCILARNCHISAYNGVMLAGCTPQYVFPSEDDKNGITHCINAVDLDSELKSAIEKGERVGAVIVVSPTYFGAVSNIQEVVSVCHSYNVPLVVDEAHGAHFKFNAAFPESALECGADVVIQSTHKVLSSLTQSAMLHLNSDRVAAQKITKFLTLLQTSSPSYLLMASLDGARHQLQYKDLFDPALSAAKVAASSISGLPGLRCVHEIGNSHSIAAFDPLRLCVNFAGWGLTGYNAYSLLENEFGIVGELATEKLVVFAFGPGSVTEDGEGVASALSSMERHAKRSSGSGFGRPPKTEHFLKPTVVMPPRSTLFADTKRVPLIQSEGNVSAEFVCPYPPGIPLLCPGELITGKAVKMLADLRVSGAYITGPDDPTLDTLTVVVNGECVC